MNILVMGLGFVGLITALGFAEKGHAVFGFDIDAKKTDDLKAGITSLSEQDLLDALHCHVGRNFL